MTEVRKAFEEWCTEVPGYRLPNALVWDESKNDYLSAPASWAFAAFKAGYQAATARMQAQLDAMTAEVTEADAMKVAKELAAHPDAPGYFPRAVQAVLTVFLANRKPRTIQTPDTQER